MLDRRAAVIGSGFGGLAAAIRLQAAGISTVLFEARDKPGGRAYVYERDGFVFDAGPTVITAPECIDELFELADRRRADYVEFLPITPFYRLLWQDGTRIDYAGGDTLPEQIRALGEADHAGYLRFLEYSRQVYDKGYRELAAAPFSNFSDMLRVAPDLMRFRVDRSVYATVARFVKDERVRQALSFHSLLVGGNPFETSSMYALIHYLERASGVFFPKGGTGKLVEALVRLYQELGGELRLDTPVERVRLEQKRGRTVHTVEWHGGRQSFDVVVSNADVHHTYARLYAGEPGAESMRRRLERADWSMSLFVLYFGTNRTYDLAHHTVVFGPRFRELLQEIFHGDHLPDDFSLYLHAPTVTDPSLAPPGHGAHYVLSPVPHLGNAALDWEALAPAYADKILGALERLMPNLRQHVVTRFWMTPRDFEQQLFAKHGAA
ncbi:MAG TPA: phytoene desaturase family protein, partial [Polyangiaceae bacterium]